MPTEPPSRPATRILVCGGRDYGDSEHVHRILDALHREHPFECIIQGGAKGADLLARFWAFKRNVPSFTYKADWTGHGKAAGPKRNQRMIDEAKPDLVIAFAGGRGTADMLRRARKAGLGWMHCTRDSGGHRDGGNPLGVPGEACQSGGKAASPNLVIPGGKDGE